MSVNAVGEGIEIAPGLTRYCQDHVYVVLSENFEYGPIYAPKSPPQGWMLKKDKTAITALCAAEFREKQLAKRSEEDAHIPWRQWWGEKIVLSKRAQNALRNEWPRINSEDSLFEMSAAEILRTPGIGRTIRKELEAAFGRKFDDGRRRATSRRLWPLLRNQEPTNVRESRLLQEVPQQHLPSKVGEFTNLMIGGDAYRVTKLPPPKPVEQRYCLEPCNPRGLVAVRNEMGWSILKPE